MPRWAVVRGPAQGGAATHHRSEDLTKLACGAAPNLAETTVVTDGTGPLVIRLDPDADARGQSAVAYRLDRA